MGGGQVVFGSQDGNVYARRTSDGGGGWTATLGSIVSGSPVIANGVVYVNSSDNLYALDAANGALLWRGAIASAGFSSPVAVNGIVYLTSTDGHLYAFSVNGLSPTSRLAGGAPGVQPAKSMLKPDYSLKPVTQSALAPAPDGAE